MTRRFVDDIRSDITTLMADNTEGAITEAITRGILTDMCDSLIPDECAILATQRQDDVAISGNWVAITTGFDLTLGGDGVWLKPLPGSGIIETNTQPGWQYEVWSSIVFEGGNNDRYDFALASNGTPGNFIASETGEGGNDPVTAQLRGFIPANAANEQIGIVVRSPDDTSIDLLGVTLGLIIRATNNP